MDQEVLCIVLVRNIVCKIKVHQSQNIVCQSHQSQNMLSLTEHINFIKVHQSQHQSTKFKVHCIDELLWV